MFARQLLLDFDGVRLRGLEPFASWNATPDGYRWRGDIPNFGEPPLEALRAALNWSQQTHGETGAAIGFFGYEFARNLEASLSECLPLSDLGLPDARLIFCRRLSREPLPAVAETSLPLVDAPEVGNDYTRGVDAIRRYIASGDIYQANLTHRFEAALNASPAQLYERLRAHPMPRAALLDFGDFAVVSNSPELFLRVRDGLVTSQPIKGTIRRGDTPQEDAQLREQLRLSVKDRAENVMIVDLLRNDFGRVCEFGSVRVPSLFALQTFPTLHHLVSTVEGKLRPECDALDAFGAAFPCGSITGAPKIRAMQILGELEPVPRGVSMGAVGYFGFDGSAEFNVAIRTATCVGERVFWHAGGGIVWDSRADDEEREMKLKASAMARALR